MITDKAIEAFGKDPTIGRTLRSAVLLYSHFVQLGSVGPDYPYLDFFQPDQKKWADHMHYDSTGDLIKTVAAKLLKLSLPNMDEDEFMIPFCWALGYISHVTADLVVHPVVFDIVGPYEGHEADHRYCEMIQDAFIYNKVRNGAEIKQSELLTVIQNASSPDDREKIHPLLREFWKDALHDHFVQEYGENPPDVDEWHDDFAEWLGVAGRPLFVGRILDPDHTYTYKKSTEITTDERARFLINLPLPNGTRGNYETDIFPKAVRAVLRKWTLLAAGIADAKLDAFISEISNADLDTGRDVATGKLIYWEGR